MASKRTQSLTKVPAMFLKKQKFTIPEDDGSQREWKIISWNVAGLRACVKKNDFSEILAEKPDILFLGETKCKEWPPEIEEIFKEYKKTLVVSKEKSGGYAGVGMLTKVAPIKISQGIGEEEFDTAGRLVVAEFAQFFFVGAYVPNSGAKLVALEKRGRWESLLTKKLKELDAQKPVIYGGDLNVAHNEIDLKNPDSNRNKTAGFTDQERGWFTDLLASGFKDTFREMHPEEQQFTFWSYMNNARSKNVGWRLDYFVVSNRIMDNVKHSKVLSSVMGSDHAPIALKIDF
ncbi:unnamed protein product [Caenorhabditis bovis]|uniref:exodeoxyribonuclease III n=1 Tax=Caenorhabditis bovis TaxID=2654633 RepID=A0A8S1F7C3_9PELO|nr:unnamed protein product [Caenorhabditis bovis]